MVIGHTFNRNPFLDAFEQSKRLERFIIGEHSARRRHQPAILRERHARASNERHVPFGR